MAAVGTVVVTVTRLQKNLEQISIAWTCDASGNVSGNPFSVGAGPIQQAKFVPGSGGTQPTNLYDVTLVDTDGCDVIVGKGANLSNTAASLGVQNAPLSWFAGGNLDLVVANAGNAKTGTVAIIIQRV
jgi:hypothetical protein